LRRLTNLRYQKYYYFFDFLINNILNVIFAILKKNCVVFSALSYSILLVFPKYFWYLSFFYLIPIFWLALNKQLYFKEGFIWGLLFYLIHFYFLFVLVLKNGNGYYKILAPIFCVIYFAFLSGAWFWFAQLFSRRLNNIFLTVLIWSLITTLYYFFIYSFSFLIFECNYGYVFSHPFVSLIECINLLNLLPILGIWLLTFFLFLFQISIAALIYTKQKNWLVMIHLSLLPFICGIFSNSNIDEKTNFFNEFGFVPIQKYRSNPYNLAVCIYNEIQKIIKDKKNTKIIFMPETAFPFALNDYPEIIKWLYNNLENKKLHILLGSHKREKDKFYNVVYHIFNGEIINTHYKTHLVFFCENVPKIWKRLFNLSSELFLKDSIEFEKVLEKNTIFEIENKLYSPIICSDIFFKKDFSKIQPSIILFRNESWFSTKYIQGLMNNYIKLKCLELRKSILCISQGDCRSLVHK